MSSLWNFVYKNCFHSNPQILTRLSSYLPGFCPIIQSTSTTAFVIVIRTPKQEYVYPQEFFCRKIIFIVFTMQNKEFSGNMYHLCQHTTGDVSDIQRMIWK